MAQFTQDPVKIVGLMGLRVAASAKAPARGALHRPRSTARRTAPVDVGAALAASFGRQELELAMEQPFAREAGSPPPSGARRRGIRRAAAPATTDDRAGVTLDVPLADGEEAIVLLEQDGVFSWQLRSEELTPPAVHRAIVRQRATFGRQPPQGAPRQRTRRFAIKLDAAPPPKPRAPALPGRKRGLGSFIAGAMVGKVVVRVFRFVARKVVGALVDHMERDIQPGLVWMGDTDCMKWRPMDRSEQLALPKDRPARVLLWVHGTFSSTLGSFGGLSQTPHGKAFLKAMLAKYDAIIGFDHPTMSVTPMQNASALLARLQLQKWPKPPVFDAICFSRGGLVFRSLVEYALPASAFAYTVDRAIFVACTNNGTELARRKNWDRLMDRYTNLAAGACTAIGALTGSAVATRILGEAIKGIGAFVKTLALAALDEGGMPGIEAMDPSGSFVRRINDGQAGQPQPSSSYYCVVTSNFDPDKAVTSGNAAEVPAGFWMRVADKPVDELMNKENDLVVDVPSMSAIDPGDGDFVKKRHDFGTNGSVYHTVYFLQQQTSAALSNWLQIAVPAPAAALRRQRKRRPKGSAVKRT
jgi:hypothetical protein